MNEKQSSEKIDVFFRGDLVAGQKVTEVRERLQKLFKANDEQMQRMFSGRPVAIRRGIDPVAAKQYQETMNNAGALVELRPVAIADDVVGQPIAEEPVTGQSAGAQTKASPPSETPQQASQQALEQNHGQSVVKGKGEIVESEFTIAPVGADMLREEDRVSVEVTEVDISALAVEELEGDILQDSEKKHVAPVEIDTSHLSAEDLPPD